MLKHVGVVLRDYQQEALQAILAAEGRGVWSQLVVLPTGCGKTVLFGALTSQRARQGQRVLILVHREELVQQTTEKLVLVDPSLQGRIGTAAGGVVSDGAAPVLVAMVQTLVRRPELTRPGLYGLVVVDEAHHAVAGQWLAVLERCAAGQPGCLLVGVTATPNRADGVGLGAVFRELVYSRSIQEMVARGVLARPKGIRMRTDVTLDRLRVQPGGGDFSDQELQAAVNIEARNQLVVRAVQEICQGRKVVVFAAGVSHAEALAERVQAAGVPAAAVSGQQAASERRQVLADFRAGRLKVVTNCNVLTEGFDEPSISAVVMARPTTSEALYIQQVGRGLRRYPGKSDCLVVDLVDNSRQHRLVQLADLFGEKAVTEVANSRSRSAAAQDREGGPGDDRSQSARLDLAGQVVQQEEADLLSPYEWVAVGDGWVLPMPEEAGGRVAYVLVPDVRGRKGWLALEWHPSPDGGRWSPLMDRLAPVEWAQGVAETAAHQRLKEASRKVAVLVERGAAWRSRPASQRQLEVLRRAGVAVTEGMTAGQATAAMTAVFWKKRVDWAMRNLWRFVPGAVQRPKGGVTG